jgi:hypothetical protein
MEKQHHLTASTSNWIYRFFEVNRPEGFKILSQPLSLLKTGDGYVANRVYTCGC